MKKLLVTASFLMMAFNSFGAASSDSSYGRYDNHISAAIGSTTGGMGFAIEYERPMDKGLGVGGIIKINPKSDTANGLNFYGAFFRPQFHSREWNLNFTMGAGLAQMKTSTEDTSLLATNFGVGIYYQMSKSLALGAEQTSVFGWFNDDHAGARSTDMMIKARYGF